MATFEWDSKKAELNRQKHGIGFDDAAAAMTGLAVTAAVPAPES
jgi:uncharacterized DUF497 family protein